MPARRDPSARFDEKVKRTESGCWDWTGAKNGGGYGTLYDRGYPALAHRVAYARFNGPIPAGFVVAHRCDRPCCVNPAHLWACTQKDNIADMYAKGRRR